MMLNLNWLLIVAGALMVLIEAALGGFAGFDLVLLGSSLIVGGGIGLVLGNLTAGIVTASALCLIYIAAGRRWVRARLKRPGVPTNVDAVVGVRAVVVQRIAEHEPGQVKVRDEVWRARPIAGGGPFEAGTEVTVDGVDGVTLTVRRAS